MSERTSCNHCSLLGIRRRAKQQGKGVTILDDARWGMGGVNVYVHPKEINVRKMEGGEDGQRARYRVAWFKELTTHCVC